MDKVNNPTADSQMLLKLSQQLLNSQSVQQTADIIVEALFARIQSFDCAFFRFESTHNQLICISYASRESQGLDSFKLKPIALGAGVVGRTAEKCQVHNVAHRNHCDYWLDYVENNVSELTVPIVHDGELLAVIDLEDDREAFFSPSDEALVKDIARLSTKFIHNQTVNEEQIFKLEKIDYSKRRAQDKESYFSMLLEHLGDPVFIISPSGKIIDLNQSAVLSLGFSKNELLGQHIQKVEQITEVKSSVSLYKNIKLNDSTVVEGIHTRKDGSRFHVEIKMAGLEDGNIIAVARDISQRNKALKDLQDSRKFLQEVIKTSPDVIFAYDFKLDKLVIGSARLADILGYSARKFDSTESIMELIHPDDREYFEQELKNIYYSEPGQLIKTEARLRDVNGDYRWLESRTLIFKRDEFGKAISKIGTVRDITERRVLKTQLQKREHYYHSLVENAFDGIALYDADGFVKFCSGSALRLLDYGESEVMSVHGSQFVYGKDKSLALEAWDWLLKHPRQVYRIPEYRITKKSGEPVWVENTFINLLDDPNVEGVISNFRDISHKKSSEQSLYKISNYDGLTELPNRVFLKRQLDRYTSQARKYKNYFTLVYFDVIQLSMINSAWGRLTGDQVLLYVVDILQKYTEDYDFIARAGDDEFAVILSQKDAFESTKFVENVLSQFESLIHIDSEEIKVSLRAAIIRGPDDGDNAEELLSKAEITSRRVKSLASQFAFYDPDDTDITRDKLTLEKELIQALNNDDLMLYYQPKICLQSGHIDSVEALLRWRHPERGFISPQLIISIAEESSLIFRLTDWVIEKAVKQISLWRKQGNNIKVSVNLSVKDLLREQLVVGLKDKLKQYQVAPELLDVEITESAALADKERAGKLLDTLKDIGVSISLDDFGTGYSSISYLTTLPIDLVKIDQSFIQKIDESPLNAKHDNKLIIKNIIRLARSFQMRSLVEGVETIEQFKLLKEYGCDLVQGYLFSRPISAEELAPIIQKGRVELESLKSI